MNRPDQKGFTIVELLVATSVFSLILLAAMAGMIQIGRLYYRGITTNRTQEASRQITRELTQAIRFTKADITVDGMLRNDDTTPKGPLVPLSDSDDVGYFCVGEKRYTYAIDRKVASQPQAGKKEIKYGLYADFLDNPDACVAPALIKQDDPCGGRDCNGRSLLPEQMRLTKLNLTNSGDSRLWDIDIFIAYGEDNDDGELGGGLVEVDGRRICEGAGFIVQFCAISEISSTAYKRVQ